MRRGPHACPKCECVSNLVDGAGTWWNLFPRPICANVQIGIRKEAAPFHAKPSAVESPRDLPSTRGADNRTDSGGKA
jgi:hypothetical protein